MLIETDPSAYYRHFQPDVNPFISRGFTELNRSKTERVVHLIDDREKPAMGLVAGVEQGILKSPFSAPFGGFHFRNQNVYAGRIDSFSESLKQYIASRDLKGIDLTLPPDIYHQTFNAKVVNSLIRAGFTTPVPDITNWVELDTFTGDFNQKNSREYYRQALRNGLSFAPTDSRDEMEEIYELIRMNRAKFNRPIHMTLDEILKTGELWPVDFFKVSSPDKSLVASAIFYRPDENIAYAVFWGDSDKGRPLRAMDFLVFHLWNFYKNEGFRYIDLGISTEQGVPNEGLLRFKE
ncbi:MAG: hypothetical protein ACOCW1_03165, partial [Chitinispirillaceae bacterium]